MKKIIFIINAIQDSHCIKRIDEFLEQEYNVEVYGFSRKANVHTSSNKFEIEILDYFDNGKNYLIRLIRLAKALIPIFKKYKKSNVLFYYFGLDIALVSTFLNRKQYIYEECDLTHTYQPKLIKNILGRIDKKIIKKSLETVLTSEGFRRYHFGDNFPCNISIIPNRINKNCIKLSILNKNTTNFSRLRIGFVGGARFDSILNFAKVFSNNFPNYEFHFFGNPIDSSKFNELKNYPNIFFHGPFQNPKDLPEIYSIIDLVLCTYDLKYENVRYAEPNKIYEAIYFETPIIVSKGTYLSDKVTELEIGFSVDPLNDDEIINFIKNLSKNLIDKKINNCKKIPKIDSINDNPEFFNKLSILLSNL